MNFSRQLKCGMKFLMNPGYRFSFMAHRGFYKELPDEEFLKKAYRKIMGRELNLESPQTFNEKLQWLKLYDRDSRYTVMVDKYLVRDYIAEKLGEEYLIPLLGVWDDPDDIDFDALPEQFVLKCNHNSGLGMCICKDKSQLNIKKTKEALRKGLREDYYLTGREWPYKNVPRKIVCEKFMVDHGNVELSDYKIHCYNGKPRFTLVCRDRFSASGLTEDFMDENWNRLDVKRPDHPQGTSIPRRPLNYEKMFEFAEKLAKDIPFVRVDFYEINGKIYFGELTFYPASGFEKFEPGKWDKTFGEWLDLPKRNK